MGYILRNVVAYLVCAIASVAIFNWIGSKVAQDVIGANLVTFVVAFLAINVQTTAVVLVKLREISEHVGLQFKATVAEIKFSILEQAILVVLSVGVSAVVKSDLIKDYLLFVDVSVLFVFYAALHIFFDISMSLLLVIFPDGE